MLALKLLAIFVAALSAVDCKDQQRKGISSISQIQVNNKLRLIDALQSGWAKFCASDVDEGVLSFYHGVNAADITVEVVGPTGNAVYSLSKLCNLCTVNFDAQRKTILFANGWVSDARIKQKLYDIAKCSDQYNLIIVDFATSISHLYRTSTHDMELATYALFKVIDTLLLQQCNYRDLIVAGFGVGAQIAAKTCQIVARERLRGKHRLPLLVAIDPSFVCGSECSSSSFNFIRPDAADKVLVIHGNNGIYGIPEAVGTIDYYPNGDCKLQPGCKSEVCSRLLALSVFAESVCHPKRFTATQCDSWLQWRKGLCLTNEVISVNLNLPDGVRGKFYSTTNDRSPYGQGAKGAQPPAGTSKRKPCFGLIEYI